MDPLITFVPTFRPRSPKRRSPHRRPVRSPRRRSPRVIITPLPIQTAHDYYPLTPLPRSR